MKVSELIEELKKMPEDAEVFFAGGFEGATAVIAAKVGVVYSRYRSEFIFDELWKVRDGNKSAELVLISSGI